MTFALDLAANWDSCVRFSCLKHGATVHTSCDIVAPYPTFEPPICMKLDGTVVLNTGNFLHVLKIDLENNRGQSHEPEEFIGVCSFLVATSEDTDCSSVTSHTKQSTSQHLKSPAYGSSEEGEEYENWRRRPLESESEDSHLSSDMNSAGLNVSQG